MCSPSNHNGIDNQKDTLPQLPISPERNGADEAEPESSKSDHHPYPTYD